MRILGVGVDLVEVERMRRALERQPTFRERVFTAQEIADCEKEARPVECFAARWAAREACVKALGGAGEAAWHDIRVERSESGGPRLVLSGKASVRAEEIGVTEVHLSLSHEGTVAAAFCVAVGPD